MRWLAPTPYTVLQEWYPPVMHMCMYAPATLALRTYHMLEQVCRILVQLLRVIHGTQASTRVLYSIPLMPFLPAGAPGCTQSAAS